MEVSGGGAGREVRPERRWNGTEGKLIVLYRFIVFLSKSEKKNIYIQGSEGKGGHV